MADENSVKNTQEASVVSSNSKLSEGSKVPVSDVSSRVPRSDNTASQNSVNASNDNVSHNSQEKSEVSQAVSNEAFQQTDSQASAVDAADSQAISDDKSIELPEKKSRRKRRENKKKKGKKEKTKKAKEEDKFENIIQGEGINLIPPMTDEEVRVEETKSSFNIGAALAILLLVVISLVIVGYNVLTKSELQKEKRKLYSEFESRLEGYTGAIVKNSFIKKRLDTYKNIQTEAIPYERVLAYWKEVSANLAEIDKIEINSNLTFEVSGSADNLEQVSKLWHFLSIDDAIESVNLEALNTDSTETSFEFKGSLNYDFFVERRY